MLNWGTGAGQGEPVALTRGYKALGGCGVLRGVSLA